MRHFMLAKISKLAKDLAYFKNTPKDILDFHPRYLANTEETYENLKENANMEVVRDSCIWE